MPFTFSHPAIVLPLKKLKPGWFSLSGLVIGSIAPDILYFLRMDGNADFGHTTAGIFLFDLPASLLLAIIFHRWVRNPLIRHMPFSLDAQYAPYLDFSFRQYLARHWPVFAVSAFLGTLSHLFWDNFAQPDGWVFHLAPAFFRQTISLAGASFRLHVLIERAGSVLGLLVIGWAVLRYAPGGTGGRQVSVQSKLTYWGSILLLTALITAFTLLVVERQFPVIGHAIVVGVSAGLYALLFVSALNGVLRKRNRPEQG